VAPLPTPGSDDEYSAVETGAVVPLLSLIFFLLALSSRYLFDLLPPGLIRLPYPALLPALAVPVFSGLGLLLGLLGLRSTHGRGLARLALFVNAVALALSGLFTWVFFRILPD
jgi:hypothetical protein